MVFGAPTRIVLCLLIGVLVGLIGVALGAPLIMVLLVAPTAAGLTVIIAKERRWLALHCLAAGAHEATHFVLRAHTHCPLWVTTASCPLFPSKRTFISAVCTSAWCQKQTQSLNPSNLGEMPHARSIPCDSLVT